MTDEHRSFLSIGAGAGLRRASSSKGRRIVPTCTCVHVPPRAVRTLRSLSLAAMALWLVAPARMISSMIGRTLAAKPPGDWPGAVPASWRPAVRLGGAVLRRPALHGTESRLTLI